MNTIHLRYARWAARASKLSLTKTRRVLALALVGLCGCSPAIYSFKAEPNRICGGDAVKLSWSASKAGVITVAQAPGQVEANGTAQVLPRSNSVRYHLEVSGLFGSAARDVDVEIADRRTGPIGQSISDPSATCNERTLSVVALAPPELVSSRLLDSAAVQARAAGGIVSVSTVLDSGAPRSDIPQISPAPITATAALKTWVEPVNATSSAFVSAIEQLAKSPHGDHALQKFPEIAHWLAP